MGQVTSQSPHTVRASAEATITAKPDQAQVSVAVHSQGPTAESAAHEDAALTSRVLDALKKAVGGGGQIKTTGFVASPQMQYPKNGGTPKITGYEATNHLDVTLNDLSLISRTLDAAIAAGATNIQGVTFSLKNDEPIRAQALAEASRKAYASAEAIAKALHLTVVGVIEAQTGEQATPVPMFARVNTQMASINSQVASTPIEPGEIDIGATVTVTLEVR